MATINTLHVTDICRHCGNLVEFRVQFRYGEVWLHDYRLGDRLRWHDKASDTRPVAARSLHIDGAVVEGAVDDANVGIRGVRKVVALAYAGPCPVCGVDGGDYEVWIADDRIVAAVPASGAHRSSDPEVDYIVLEK